MPHHGQMARGSKGIMCHPGRCPCHQQGRSRQRSLRETLRDVESEDRQMQRRHWQTGQTQIKDKSQRQRGRDKEQTHKKQRERDGAEGKRRDPGRKESANSGKDSDILEAEGVAMAGEEEVGRVDLHWGICLPGPLSPSGQVAGLLWPARLLLPSLLFFSTRKPGLDAGLHPPSPTPPGTGMCLSLLLSGVSHALLEQAQQVPGGLETTNDSLLTGCWLPPACQPFPLHTADNHVRQGNPSCPWSCDLNLNFALLFILRRSKI